jgi:hypothetical protein
MQTTEKPEASADCFESFPHNSLKFHKEVQRGKARQALLFWRAETLGVFCTWATNKGIGWAAVFYK